MPSIKNGGNIKFGVDFEANQASLNKLKKSLQDLQKIKFGNFDGSKQEFNEVKSRISEIQDLIRNAFNPTLNTSNITAFKSELEKSGMSLRQIQSDFSRFGSTGDRAFNQLTTSILTTNLKLKETNSLVDSMGKTMVNTVKWGVASSVMNTFTQSVQGAFQYVQSLEKSLTNIRIVTGDSTEKMAQFAEQANRSAQALGRSTLDYTKASLTFYQQGLNSEEVQARTEATLKAQNITGAGSQMADYLTSVWNGYKVANEEAEIYVDKLAAVADSSASDMNELAIAMSKVASTANTMGVDIDQLNAQIATVVATTRQAPESVGTAFKTIYTRMNDIKTGADDAEVSLGKYSGTMASLGFNVLDATGHLRDTGQVMEEIGGRWQDLTREQQIYLAQTMGGQRQVNQLMALFNNWTTYSELLNTSLESEGTLAEKNSRYMESLGAKMEQLGAAGERVKDALIDSDSMKTVIEALTSVTNLVANLFETMGSGQTILLALGSTITQLFSGTIAKEINNVIVNMQNMKTNAETIRNQLEMTKMVQDVGKNTPGGTLVADRMAEIQQYYSVMDQASINNQKNFIAERGQIQNNILKIKEEREAVERLARQINEAGEALDWSVVNGATFQELNDALGNMQESLSNVKDLASKDLFEDWDPLSTTVQNFSQHFNKFVKDYNEINPEKAAALEKLFNDFSNNLISGGSFSSQLAKALNEANREATQFSNTISNSKKELDDAKNRASMLDKAIKDGADSAKQLFDVTNAIKMISAIGQISSSLLTIKNLKTIWDDKDVSTGEKIAKTFTSLGFIIPSLYSSYKSIANAMGITNALSARQLTIEKAITKEKEKQQLLEKKARLEQQIKNLNASGKLSVEKAKELNKEYKTISQDLNKVSSEALSAQAAVTGLSGKISTAFGAAITSVSGFTAAIAPILPILIGIGVVVGVGYLIYKDFNKAKEAAEQAAKVAQDAKRNYDNLKESFKNLTSAITDYKDAKTALNELTTGTEEWRDAVNDLNDKVLQLIENFPELANYLERTEDGILSINQEGFDEITNKARQKTYAAGISRANLQENAFNAERQSRITDEGRRIYGEYNGKDTLNKAIDVLQNGNFSGESGLEKALRDTNSFSEAQIAATIQNSEAIYKLINSLEAEQARVDTLKDTYLKTALQNEDIYKNTLNKDALTDIVSSVFDQNTKELNEKYYKDPDTKWTLDRNALFDRYEEITGKDVKETGLINKKIEADGEQISLESIASLVASADSLQNVSQDLEEAANRLSRAQSVFDNTDERTKQLLFNSGLAGGFDKVNTDSLSQVDVNKLKGLNQNDLADFLGIDVKKIPSKLEELGASVQEGLDSFINGIEEGNTRAVMLQLKDKYGSDLSRELAESIAQNVQDGYQKVGTESGNAIKDFYKKLSGDQVEDIANLTEEYNYAGNSVEDFIKAVREIGVTSEKISDDMIIAFYNAQSKIQDIQIRENRLDLDKVNAGSGTAGLAQKVENGEKLSDKELESMKEGLEDLKKVYPSLTKEVEILKNAQLAGTQSYQESLRKLKAALMASYEDMLKLNEVDYSQISNSLKGLIATTEDLQNARGRGLLTEETNSEIIINLASKYQSCKDQIEKYTLALQSNDDQLRFTQGLNLETALRSAELAQKYGLEASSIEELSRHYQELWMQQGSNRQSIQKNAELATEAAVAYMRLNQGIEELQKSYSDVETVLDTLQQYDIEEVLGDADLSKKFNEIRGSVAKLLNTSEDLIDSDFVEKYADQIKSLANGSEDAEEALADLQKGIAELSTENLLESLGELGQEGLKTIKVDLDDDGFNETLLEDQNKLNEWLQSIPQGELSLNDLNAINSLINLMQQAGWSAAEIEQYFRNQNIDLDIMDAEAALATLQNQCGEAAQSMAEALGINTEVVTEENKNTDVVETPSQSGYWNLKTADFVYPVFSAIPAGPLGGVNVETGQVKRTVVGQEWVTTPNVEQTQASSSRTAVALSAVAGNKRSFGGGISHKNKTGGNKKSSGGGGKKGGGGGGSKAKEPNKAKGATNKADRYRNNTVKANKLANQMTKLNKQQERLTGKDALKNLQKQLEILEKQKDVIRERLGLQRDEQNELANNLKKYGATFDKDGTLNNYFVTHDRILKEYNDKVAKWNQMTAEQQESNKDYLNNAKEIMDQAFKDLERYDKLQQEIAKTQQQQIDKVQEQIDLKVKQLDLKIKAELDLSEAKRDWNKFQRDIVNEIRDDDVLGLNRFRFADIASYYNDAGTGSIQNLTDRLKEVMGDENGIFSGSYLTQQLANMSITDRAAQLEKIKEIFDDLQDQMEGFKEIADEIKESIFDAIDAAQDAFDEQMDEYEYLGDLIDHNMKVTEMFFGDEAYDQMVKFYDRIEENNNAQLDFLAKQKDLWYSRMVEEQARMDQLVQTQGTDSNLYKEARDRFEEYKKHWMDTVKDLNSTVEDALDNIMDKYNNAINGILANFELKLGDGHTLDDIGDEWDILNDQADRYFDKINAAYEIDKLENAFNDAINDNDGDIAAQQSLNDLMEQQLAYLRDKERLTQYDVDRANTLLQIEMKRLALEQSRSNKNRLRLRRDSQGNYTYQYTADTEAISKAEQELADAQNSLYNSDKAAYVDNLSDIQKSAENIKNKLEDIWTDENLSKEQKLQKSYELEKYYGDQINKLLEDNANIRNNLIQSSTEELAKIYGINIEQFQALTDEEQINILKDLIPQAGSYLSNMVEGLIGQGGIGKLFEDSINRFLQAEDERINSIAEIEKNGQISFEDIINDTSTVIGQAEQLLDNNEALINSYEQELNAVQNTINGVNELIQTYERAKQAAIQAATAANDLLISNNAETTGSSLAQEQAAQNVNDNVFNTWTSRNNSYGDLSNFTPYSPNWHSSDYATIFGSSNVSLADLATYQEALQNTGSTTSNIIGQSEYTPINVNSILDTIQSNVSHINDILEALHTESSNYYENALNKAKDIERAIIANQTVHIDADFPNARDVSNIIDAINNLTLVAAQKAGKI